MGVCRGVGCVGMSGVCRVWWSVVGVECAVVWEVCRVWGSV